MADGNVIGAHQASDFIVLIGGDEPDISGGLLA